MGCRQGVKVNAQFLNRDTIHRSKPFIKKLIFAVTLLSLGLSVQAQGPASPERPDAVRSYLQPLIDNHTVAGAVTLVATRDRILYLKSAGYRDLAAKGSDAGERDVLDRIHIKAHDGDGLHDAGG
jgi:hypothetical protein